MRTRRIVPIIVLLSLLCGCGTEIGNPRSQTTGMPNGSAVTSPGGGTTSASSDESNQILSAICAKLDACYPSLSASSCASGVLPVTNLAPALGLAAGFGSYQSIINAETAGTIVPNQAQAASCISDIQALSCSGTPSAAYNPASPNVFTNVVNLVPTSSTSCAGVF